VRAMANVFQGVRDIEREIRCNQVFIPSVNIVFQKVVSGVNGIGDKGRRIEMEPRISRGIWLESTDPWDSRGVCLLACDFAPNKERYTAIRKVVDQRG
jgi:hypothetical protein